MNRQSRRRAIADDGMARALENCPGHVRSDAVATNGGQAPLTRQPAEAAFFRMESDLPASKASAMAPDIATSSGAPVMTSPPGWSNQIRDRGEEPQPLPGDAGK